MNIYELNVKKPYLSYILDGQKTIEGRLNRGKFAKISKDDILIVGPDKIKFKLIQKTQYPNFRKMLQNEDIINVLPDQKDINEGVQVYYKFYTPEDERKFRVVALKIQKV